MYENESDQTENEADTYFGTVFCDDSSEEESDEPKNPAGVEYIELDNLVSVEYPEEPASMG